MGRKHIRENLERIYSRMGYVLLDVNFITDRMIKLTLLTPRWTIKEVWGIVEIGTNGNFQLRILRT